ncbi:MAG: group 1 truncated hemoglobin [Pseudomonadota bacterium]
MSQAETMSESLFDRLGGGPAVEAAVDLFYEKVLADPLLAPMFEGVDMARQKRKQRSFLTLAFGGPNTYSGAGMRAAHRRLVEEKGLSDDHFDAVMACLGATLADLSVPDPLIAEAAAIAESVRDDVLGR